RGDIGAQRIFIFAELIPVYDKRTELVYIDENKTAPFLHLFDLRIFDIERARKRAAARGLYGEHYPAEVVHVERIRAVGLLKLAGIQHKQHYAEHDGRT